MSNQLDCGRQELGRHLAVHRRLAPRQPRLLLVRGVAHAEGEERVDSHLHARRGVRVRDVGCGTAQTESAGAGAGAVQARRTMASRWTRCMGLSCPWPPISCATSCDAVSILPASGSGGGWWHTRN
eukprot:scaffold7565_cov80-Phaeocystis_antarctica.AAC.5